MVDGFTAAVSRRRFLNYLGAGAVVGALWPWAARGQPAPVVFGLTEPLTGANSFFGEAAVKAARLAIDQINNGDAAFGIKGGGVLGRPLKLEVADAGSSLDVTEVVRSVQELAAKKVDFMGGLFQSEHLLGIMPLLPEVKKIFLGTGASTRLAVTDFVAKDYDKFKYFFRIGPTNDLFILAGLVDFGQRALGDILKVDSIFVLAEDAAWTATIRALLPAMLAPKVKVVKTVAFPVSLTDFSSIYSDAAASGADAIFTIMAHTGFAATVQWAQAKPNMPMVGVNVAAQDARFYAGTNKAAESVVTLTSSTRSPVTTKTVPFFDKYAATEPKAVAVPSYNAAYQYDAMFILREAIERAGTIDTDKVVVELEKTDYLGAVGRFRFYGKDPVNLTQYKLPSPPLPPALPLPHDVQYGINLVYGVWIQWQGGSQNTIWPPEFAQFSFTLPPWMKAQGVVWPK